MVYYISYSIAITSHEFHCAWNHRRLDCLFNSVYKLTTKNKCTWWPFSTHGVDMGIQWYHFTIPSPSMTNMFGHRQHIANPTFLLSRTLRPSTPPDVLEDAINGSRADEDANLSTQSRPDNTTATIWRQLFGNPSFRCQCIFIPFQCLVSPDKRLLIIQHLWL